jgi:outer membrane protein OmpA-like peptidoglycan-associated protein
MVLLGLMVLALIIAWASKGCGDSDEPGPAAQSPTTASTTTGTGVQAVEVIDQINNLVTQQGGVQFVVGKTDLTARSRTTLNQVATVLKNNATVKAEVRGYTDNEGDEQKNLQLSQQRAAEVVKYLVQQGIATERLSARGFGEANPLVPNDTDENKAKNRRVEFAVG